MYEFVIGWRLGFITSVIGLVPWFITSVIGPCVFGVYGAGVVVISIEGPDVSESLGLPESRDILSPVGHL
jgi:hypothetical protein